MHSVLYVKFIPHDLVYIYVVQIIMSWPRGLVAKYTPNHLSSVEFGNVTNCFTFMTGFDDDKIQRLGVAVLRPEDLGWDKLETTEEWKKAVADYFNFETPSAQIG